MADVLGAPPQKASTDLDPIRTTLPSVHRPTDIGRAAGPISCDCDFRDDASNVEADDFRPAGRCVN